MEGAHREVNTSARCVTQVRPGFAGFGDARISSARMAQYSLDEPLPAEVFDGVSGPWMRYRAFPTYGRQWFWRQTALFASPAGGVARLFPGVSAPPRVILWFFWNLFAILFFCPGGGVALRTCFREQGSWMDAQRTRELARLRLSEEPQRLKRFKPM